jgi:hypothetical protein
MALARTSSGKISPTVRYPAEAPAEAKKKITDQHSVWVTAFSVPALNSCAVTKMALYRNDWVIIGVPP